MTATKGALVFVLTGAGISAESGLGTFRDKEGLWTQYNLAEVASIQGYRNNPGKVLEFYNARRRNLVGAAHNAAHAALGQAQAALAAAGAELFLCTQNVDDLHEQGGALQVHHMHGELLKARCEACGTVVAQAGDISLTDNCTRCGAVGQMRPHIVWFGEYPLGLDLIEDKLQQADLFVAIGTSGSVYPAAGFVDLAKRYGAQTLELNLEPSDGAELFDEGRYGPASAVVPAWVDSLRAGVWG